MSTCYGCRHLAGKLETARSGVHVCVRTYPHRLLGSWNGGQEDTPIPLEDDCKVGGYVFRLPDDPIECD